MARHHRTIVAPPATSTVMPVIQLASSETKNRTVRARELPVTHTTRLVSSPYESFIS